jgi:DNA-binding response OmpR family regulator
MHILLIESDTLNQTESLVSNLEKQGHHVSLAHTPEIAAQQTATLWPNLIVLNASANKLMPSDFGQTLSDTTLNIPCYVITEQSDLPITHSNELVLVDSVLRLEKQLKTLTATQKERFIRLPSLVIDRKQRRLLRASKTYSLTPKEFKLLHLLVEHRNEILSRKQIMQEVWETDYMGDTRTLDVHIRWLREKLEDNPSRPRQLVTIRGVGYSFVVETKTR